MSCTSRIDHEPFFMRGYLLLLLLLLLLCVYPTANTMLARVYEIFFFGMSPMEVDYLNYIELMNMC